MYYMFVFLLLVALAVPVICNSVGLFLHQKCYAHEHSTNEKSSVKIKYKGMCEAFIAEIKNKTNISKIYFVDF